MDLDKLIVVNRKVEVSAADVEKKEYYRSIIQVVQPNTFAIDIPTKKRVPWLPHRGDEIELSIVNKDARFEFTTPVVKREIKDLPLLVLRMPNPETVRRIQLRQHVRVPVSIDVLYLVLTPEELKQEDYKLLEPQIPGKAIDLSGGGMRLVTDQLLTANTQLLLAFKLDECEYKLPGCVRLSAEQKLPGKQIFLNGISFENITMGVQDEIVSFCFRKQLKANKAKD